MQQASVLILVPLMFIAACGPGGAGAPCSSTNDCAGGLVCSSKVCARQILLTGVEPTGEGTSTPAAQTPTQPQPSADPDFSLSAGSLAALSPSSSSVLTFSVARQAGFTAPVTVTLDGLASGLSASSVVLSATDTSGSLVVNASGATCATSAATLTATGGGKTHQVSVSVTVSGGSGFVLATSQALVTMLRGASASFDVSLTREVCATGAASVVIENLVSGVSSNVVMTGDSARVTLNAAPGAALGASSFTIKGSIGTAVQSASISLTLSTMLSGRVVGSALGPVRARVEIVGGPCVETEADGTFSLSAASLVAPYNLRVSELATGETCSTNKQATLAYVGLTSQAPTLTWLASFGTGWSTSSLEIDDLWASCSAATHATPTGSDKLAVMHAVPQGLEWSYVYDSAVPTWNDPSGNQQSAPTSAWLGTAPTVSGPVHMLRYSVDANGLPETYSGYKQLASATVSSGGSTCFDSWDLALDPISTRSAPVTLTRSVPAGLSGSFFAAFAALGSGAKFNISNPEALSTPRSQYVLPNVAATLGLREFYGSIGSRLSYAVRAGLPPSGAVSVDFMPPPTLTAHGASGVCGGNNYCWNSRQNTVNVFSVNSGACKCGVVTADAKVSLTAGMCASGCSPPTSWSVMRFSPFESVDAATTSAGFSYEAAGLFGGLYGIVFLMGAPKQSLDVSVDSATLP